MYFIWVDVDSEIARKLFSCFENDQHKYPIAVSKSWILRHLTLFVVTLILNDIRCTSTWWNNVSFKTFLLLWKKLLSQTMINIWCNVLGNFHNINASYIYMRASSLRGIFTFMLIKDVMITLFCKSVLLRQFCILYWWCNFWFCGKGKFH